MQIDSMNTVLKGVLGYGYFNLKPVEKFCKYNMPEKVWDYFYSIEYEDYNYNDAYEYIEHLLSNNFRENRTSFACSTLRKGKYTVRSFDWLYNETPNFFIRTKATRGKYATIGSSFAMSNITAEMIDSGKDLEFYKYLPFFTVDVLNEKGVYINSNVVTPRDAGRGIPTDQNTGKQRMCQLMLVRYLGDYANTAKHAIELLKGVDAFAPLSIIDYETHFMICDKEDSFIVEYVDNELKVIALNESGSESEDGYIPMPNNKAIMTNFYEYNWNGETKAYYNGYSETEVKATGLTAHSCGLERYDILSELYSGIDSLQAAKEAAKKIAYTNTYKAITHPRWYSEYTGISEQGDVNIWNTDKSVFESIDAHATEVYDEGRGMKRDGKFWISSHSSIYDLEKKVLYICSEEHYDIWRKFSLTSSGDISSIEDLDDVEFTDLEKDDFISYDSRDGKWKNVDFPLEMKTDDEEETLVLNINVFND